MKRLHFHSFRQRLNAAFLAVSLAPLLLCSALLLQIFRFRMTADQQQNAQQQLSSACHALNTMQDGILSAAESLQRDGLVTRALAGAQEDSAKVYSSLYTATAAVRSTARFDLYSADGTLLYSTQAAPGEDALSPDWGILYEAAQAENGSLVYSASEDPTDPDAPVLRTHLLRTHHALIARLLHLAHAVLLTAHLIHSLLLTPPRRTHHPAAHVRVHLLRLLTQLAQHRHRLHRVQAVRRLTRQHHRVRAVQNGVRHVGAFRARRTTHHLEQETLTAAFGSCCLTFV